MKILLIDVNCKSSSTGNIVYDLYTAINDNMDEAAICYGRGPVLQGKNIFKFGLDYETRFHAIMARITGLNGYFSPISTIRLINFIKEFKPDVVHIHELHAYFVNLKPLLQFLKKQKIKIVWTFHCEYMYTGKCGYTYDCNKYISECGHCPAKKTYPKSLVFDCTRKMFNDKKNLLADMNFTIVTPSRWLSEKVQKSFLKERKIEVVHNGVDTDVFYPRSVNREKYQIESDRLVVLSVSSEILTNPRRGGQWVLKLAEIMPETLFILVGVTDVNIPHPNNVRLVLRTKNQDELAEYYSLADVHLLCSELETYSMPCAESICCGTPVVGFKCGAPETVFNNKLSSFVNQGDIEMLKQKIIWAKDLKKRCESEFEKERNKLSIATMYNEYMKFYVEK